MGRDGLLIGEISARSGVSTQTPRRTRWCVKMSLCLRVPPVLRSEIAGAEVRIGENGNLAVLKKEEWNVRES
jgi:hypothetical protein